ncbi:MAG TPA: Clp protease N-terminal domain-containing protein, partial [Thermoanaerobaculia bacterium]
MSTDSPELARIAAEALDIAKGAGQPPSTVHLLLAIFTVPGPADVLLRERGCDEDRVLAKMVARPDEPAEGFAQALDRARQLADDCGSDRAEGLHLLVALTRLSRSAAAQLLERTVQTASLRTTALGYVTGSIPRRRVREEVRAYAPARAPSVVARSAPSVPPGPALSRAAPSIPPAQAPARGPLEGSPTESPLPRASPTPAGASPSPEDRWELDPRVYPHLH